MKTKQILATTSGQALMINHYKYKTINQYKAELRAAARLLWSGSISLTHFYNRMSATVHKEYRKAWYEGAKTMGLMPDELSKTELNRLNTEIAAELSRVYNLAIFVLDNQQYKGGLLRSIFNRIDKWVTGYVRIREMAKMFAAKDKKLRWTMHPAEHCSSCRKLEGKVKRASYWKAHSVSPKSWSKLECKLGCKCTLEHTFAKCTPGPLPNLP